MKRVKTIFKFIGLIFLILSMNIFPMKLIATQAATPQVMQWGLALAYLVVAPALIYWVWRRYMNTLPADAKPLRFGWKDFGWALLFFLAARIVAILGTILIQILTGNATSANDAALLASRDQVLQMFPLYFIAFHLAIGLYAPILEELVFRGIFSRYFFQHGTKWIKLLVSSTIFSLLHSTIPIEFFLYFALGALFYLAYARRENIKDSIAVHILNNSLLVIVSVVNYLLLHFG